MLQLMCTVCQKGTAMLLLITLPNADYKKWSFHSRVVTGPGKS